MKFKITKPKNRLKGKGYFLDVYKKIEGTEIQTIFIAVTAQELLDLLKLLKEREKELRKEE